MDIKERGRQLMNDILCVAKNIPAKVSTITIAFKTNSCYDLNKVLEGFKDEQVQEFIEEVVGDINNITTSHKKNFNNSIIFKCEKVPTNTGVLDKQAVKVFCNGSLHITGVKDINDAFYLAEVFLTMLELIYGGSGGMYMFHVTGFEVQLMNFYFTLSGVSENKVLDLTKVYHHIQKNSNYSVSYNNEHHAGVIVRAPDFVVLVFDSGNVIICSIQTPEQLSEANEFVQRVIYPLPELYHCEKTTCANVKRRRKDSSSQFDYAQYLVLK